MLCLPRVLSAAKSAAEGESTQGLGSLLGRCSWLPWLFLQKRMPFSMTMARTIAYDRGGRSRYPSKRPKLENPVTLHDF